VSGLDSHLDQSDGSLSALQLQSIRAFQTDLRRAKLQARHPTSGGLFLLSTQPKVVVGLQACFSEPVAITSAMFAASRCMLGSSDLDCHSGEVLEKLRPMARGDWRKQSFVRQGGRTTTGIQHFSAGAGQAYYVGARVGF